METSTINSKGQFTIPAAMRKKMGIHSGDTVRLFIEEDGSLCVIPATGSITDIYGLLKKKGQKPVSLEAMNTGIEKAAADHVLRHARD